MLIFRSPWAIALFAGLLSACSAGGAAKAGESSSDGSSAAGGGEAIAGTGSAGGGEGQASGIDIPVDTTPIPDGSDVLYEMPAGFTAADVGGYRLVGPLADVTPVEQSDSTLCGNVMQGVVRDFSSQHVDFESYCCWQEDGLVESILGADMKPVFAGGEQITSTETFFQWYRTIADVNQAFLVEFYLAPQADGIFSFSSSTFFPVNGVGFGNEEYWENFHFTTEFHTKFLYSGGEIFTFSGDDDLWVFINNQLVIDLGGVHDNIFESVAIDALGLQAGEIYPLDLFHAERHTAESNFQIETTLQLVNCGIIVPDNVT